MLAKFSIKKLLTWGGYSSGSCNHFIPSNIHFYITYQSSQNISPVLEKSLHIIIITKTFNRLFKLTLYLSFLGNTNIFL